MVSGRQKSVRIQIVKKIIFCRKNEFYLEKWDIWQIVHVRACACLCVRVSVCGWLCVVKIRWWARPLKENVKEGIRVRWESVWGEECV